MDQRHLGEACLAFERWDRFAMLIESGATDLGDHDVGAGVNTRTIS